MMLWPLAIAAAELLPPASLHVTDDGKFTYSQKTTTSGGFRVLTTYLNPSKIDPFQVHEVVVDGKRGKVYVSLLTTSQLFELDLGPSGELSPVAHRWTFNTNESGLHNIAPSACHPGGLWVSTQYDNQVHLVDPATGYAPVRSVRVPRLLHNGTAWGLKISEPHSVREAADCTIWVALKGATRNVPAGFDDIDYTEAYDAMTVLDPDLPRNHSDGHAVWHLLPSAYNESAFPGLGGKLHAALPTPVMSAVDGRGNTFHAQDCSPSLLRIDPAGGETQVPVGLWFQASGPGTVAAPDGSVWVCSLTRDDGLLLRFRPGTVVPEPFEQLTHLGGGKRRTIHVAFATERLDGTKANMIYVLTSSLLIPKTTPAIEEVIGYELDDEWNDVAAETGGAPVLHVTLPVQHSATHRIALAEPTHAGAARSLIVTGLATSVLFQLLPGESKEKGGGILENQRVEPSSGCRPAA